MMSIFPVIGLVAASAFPCVAPKAAQGGYSDGYEFLYFSSEELTSLDGVTFYEDFGDYCEVYLNDLKFVVGEKKAEELYPYSFVAFSLPMAVDSDVFETPYSWIDYDTEYVYRLECVVGTAFTLYFSNVDTIVLGQEQAGGIIDGIGDGLSVVGKLVETFKDGFTSFVLNPDGSLSVPAIFAFSLMGIGISVGVVKLTFHWLTGRHGM